MKLAIIVITLIFGFYLISTACVDLNPLETSVVTTLDPDSYEDDNTKETTTNIIVVDATQAHTLSPANDVDYMILQVNDLNYTYKFQVIAGSGLATLQLIRPDGLAIRTKSYYYSNPQDMFEYTFSSTGDYIIYMSTLADLVVDYKVVVTRRPRDYTADAYEPDNGPVSTLNTIPMNNLFDSTLQVHNIHYTGDRDFYRLQINDASLNYTITLSGINDGTSNPTPRFYTFSSDGATQIPPFGASLSATIKFDSTGDYYLQVFDFFGGLGQYTFQIIGLNL